MLELELIFVAVGNQSAVAMVLLEAGSWDEQQR
jgi:hypothetical protein